MNADAFSASDTLTAGVLVSPLTVVDLTVEGEAVARHKGRVIFLDRGLPGEVVGARVARVAKKIVHAVVEESLTLSPHEVAQDCPHFPACGACAWRHLAPQAAEEWKRGHVRQTLRRIGKIVDPEVRALAVPAHALRNKMAFAAERKEGHGLILGLRRRGSREVLDITACRMQPDRAMNVLARIRESAPQLGIRAEGAGRLRFVVIHTPVHLLRGKTQTLVECITGPCDTPAERQGIIRAMKALGEDLLQHGGVTGFVHSERRHSAELAQGEAVLLTLGDGGRKERFGPLVLSAPVGTFLQTSTAAAELLYARVKEAAGARPTDVLWDVYAGVGAIGLSLAPHLAEAHCLEIQAEAVRAAEENARLLKLDNIHMHQGILEKKTARRLPPPDVIVLDPPRNGLSAEAVEVLRNSPARRLVYVSCDPASQARDIAALAGCWKLEYCAPVDMFPCTPHVENVAILSSV